MKERILFKVIGRVPYRLMLKGNTVVEMEPTVGRSKHRNELYNLDLGYKDGPGAVPQLCPLYQRDQYKQDKAPMKRVTRFVPKEEVIRW